MLGLTISQNTCKSSVISSLWVAANVGGLQVAIPGGKGELDIGLVTCDNCVTTGPGFEFVVDVDVPAIGADMNATKADVIGPVDITVV